MKMFAEMDQDDKKEEDKQDYDEKEGRREGG